MEQSRTQEGQFLETALSASMKAEALINKLIGEGFTTRAKEDGSFVTDVDVGAEEVIRIEIEKTFPGHDVTGEELGASNKDSEYRWFLDPIDGTLSVKFGLPFFGTIIFLCFKSQPILCVINHPSLNLLFRATLGGGAYCNDRRFSLNDVQGGQVRNELVATGDRYAFELAGSLDEYKRLLDEHPLVRTIPDCYGHTLAARGTVGAMVDHYLNYWDYAATKLLVEEAGGKFVITGSRELDDGRTTFNVICGKPTVVDWLAEIFR